MISECLQCGEQYVPKSPHHMFCSTKCCGAYNAGRTWDSYFRKLIQKTDKRKSLTVRILNDILQEQDGLCALSGVPLTRITGYGVISTNASIDRIKAGGDYTKDNIRLVCSYVNSFRGNLSDEQFRWWCKRVVDNGK